MADGIDNPWERHPMWGFTERQFLPLCWDLFFCVWSSRDPPKVVVIGCATEFEATTIALVRAIGQHHTLS